MRYFAYRTWQIQQAKADSGHMTQRHRIMDLCLIFQSPENKVHTICRLLYNIQDRLRSLRSESSFNKPIPYILTESYPYIAFCYFKVYLTPLPAPVFSGFSFQSGCSEYVLLYSFPFLLLSQFLILTFFLFP